MTRIFEDERGAIWFYSSHHGYFIRKEGTFQQVDVAAQKGKFLYISFDAEKQMVTAFDMGRDSVWTAFFDQEQARFISQNAYSLPIPNVNVAYYQGENLVLKHDCQTPNAYACQQYFWLTGNTFIPLPPSPFFQHEQIYRLVVLSDDRIVAMVASHAYGSYKNTQIKLFEFNGEVWKPYSQTWNLKDEVYQLEGSMIEIINKRITLRLSTPDGRVDLVEFATDPEQFAIYPFFPGAVVRSGIVKDQFGTFWQVSGAGLFRIYPHLIHILPSMSNPEMPSDLFAIGQSPTGQIWLGSYSKGLYFLDESCYPHAARKPFGKNMHVLPGHIQDAEGNMLFSIESEPHRGILQFDGNTMVNRLLPHIAGFCFAKHSNGRILYGSSKKGLFVSKSSELCADTSCWVRIGDNKGLKLFNVQCVAIDEQNHRYWMARQSEGIAVYDYAADFLVNFMKEDDPENIGAITMEVDSLGGLWVGSDEGLFYLAPQEKIDQNFSLKNNLVQVSRYVLTKENGLPQRVRALKVYQDSLLAISTERGLGMLNLKTFYQSGKPEFMGYFDDRNGYHIGEGIQNGLLISSDQKLWIAGEKGVICFDPNKYTLPPSAFHITIDSVKIGRDVFYPKDGSVIHAKAGEFQGKIWVGRQAPNPMLSHQLYVYGKDKGDKLYQGQMMGGYFPFEKVPGTYHFDFSATSEGKTVSTSLTIIISPVFYKRTSFWAILLLVLMLIILVWYRTIQRWALERNNLHIQAIVNQLNPHFINNALQFLQTRAYKSKDMVSFEALNRIGQNIGIIFQNSHENKAFHSLTAEMQFVNNFLDIQRWRYKDDITYQVPNEEDLKRWAHIKVPLMIIQIHVENAIEHGIRNRASGQGTVKLTMQEDGSYLVIQIEDDGIGPIKASKIKSRGTQQGLKMLDELMHIFNRKNKVKMSRTAIGEYLQSPNGEPYGMKVTLKIPKNYRYE